jgi:hypothetical protein
MVRQNVPVAGEEENGKSTHGYRLRYDLKQLCNTGG